MSITDTVIKAVDAMGKREGMTSLKFADRYGNTFESPTSIAGVDGSQMAGVPAETETEDNDEDYEPTEQEDADDEDYEYDEDVEENETEDLATEWKFGGLDDEWGFPEQQEPTEEPTEEPNEPIDENEQYQTNLRRSTRDVPRPESYAETGRRVHFQDTNLSQLEQSHNITTNTYSETYEYEPEHAAILAHLIIQLYQKASAKELQCGPQLPLNRGLKKFGDRGRAAAGKEVGQLHD